jgi:hypothetical protein
MNGVQRDKSCEEFTFIKEFPVHKETNKAIAPEK